MPVPVVKMVFAYENLTVKARDSLGLSSQRAGEFGMAIASSKKNWDALPEAGDGVRLCE